MKKNKIATIIGVLPFLVWGCGDSTSPPTPSRVVVTPNTVSMESLGETKQFSARVEDDTGKEVTGASVTWSSSDPTVAEISSAGLLTGLKAGSTTVTATAEGLSGTASVNISPVPKTVTKVAGDGQVGGITGPLQVAPTVEVVDGNGHPVVGVSVTFSVVAGGGTVSSGLVTTDSDGRASTTWQLGCSNVDPQRLEANISGLSVVFTATADLSQLAICPNPLPQGRLTLAYTTQLVAAGGDQSTLAWSVSSGALPAGITLQPDGTISGTPLVPGPFNFSVLAQDGAGHTASRDLQLTVCEAPLSMASGESQVLPLSGSGGCGFFLPSGSNGDRYRIGVIYANSDGSNPDDVPSVTVAMTKQLGSGAPPQAGPVTSPAAGSRETTEPAPIFVPGLDQAIAEAEATEALHDRIRRAERELLRSLGPNARPLPDTRKLVRSSGPQLASPDKVSFTNPTNFNSCDLGETRRAVKVAENDVLVIYQDSIQRADTAMSVSNAQLMLDYFRDYGQQVIDTYFGGVTDLDGNGKIVVFVTPVVESGTAAFVWSGDFFPKTSQPGWGACPASNQMELIRFSLSTIRGMSNGNYQALGTVVHESKHVSSLYKSIIRDDLQPLWVEEGTAEIAGEISSRLAWEAIGGPAVGSKVVASDVGSINKENYGIILRMARTVGYLASQPNGVVVAPTGASEDESVYGSGWHFHRWLGDAYGHASTRLGDAPFFTTLNDSLTAAGVPGIEDVTADPDWTDLMSEYATAVMLNGTSAPQGARPFTTYNFPSLNKTFTYTGKPSGDYPWPVNVSGSNTTATFGSSTSTGAIGPSGLRVYDLTSDGTGLGLEVKVSSTFTVQPVRVVVVRIN